MNAIGRNAIEDMRNRLSERFRGVATPLEGLRILNVPPTANMAPRMPQSNIPSQKSRYSQPGRPSISEPQKHKKWEGGL